MADTFSANLRIRLIQTGAYNNAWGAILNSDALAMLDDALGGKTALTVNSTSFSMAALGNGVDSDSRAFFQKFSGAPGGAFIVTVPATVAGGKFYLVDNSTDQQMTMKYVASADVAVVAAGKKSFVWCDGANCYVVPQGALDAATLGGLSASNFARTARTADEVTADTRLNNAYPVGVVNSSPWFDATEAPTTTLDASKGNNQRLTLTGNRVMAAPSSPVDGEPILLQVRQDGSGARTLSWNSIFLHENGTSPTLATAPGAIDLFLMVYDAGLTKWLVGRFGGISAPSGASADVTIDRSGFDISLLELVGTIGVATTVNLTIARGAILQAASTGSWALDLYNALPNGSTINLLNLGFAIAHGGEAGDGAAFLDQGGGLGNGNNVLAYDGKAGGVSIRGPGPGITLNITNANGHIWGGGGGGGGGGATQSGGSTGNGGGGGGGAGGGRGGRGGRANGALGVDGGDGRTGVLGTNGTAGTGAGTGSAGGNGGTYGVVGDAGVGTSPGAAGAAGKAIELMGGVVTWVNGSGAPNVLGAVS